MVSDIAQENRLFSKKSYLDTLTFPSKIIGRQDKAKELVRLFLGYKQELVVPFISVYGRSGSGKSTMVRFVCENLDDISYCFVNLRKAKTVFGCANLILAELGQPNLKVLVLDEFDVLFNDARGKPSDFVYNLVVMEENLREKGHLVCVVAISNNVMSDYELDDRVRSRIGSSEVFFGAYSKKDVLAIIKDRAQKAFSDKIDPAVIQYCAEYSSAEHGDARRAIDLLRVAAELASLKGERISKSHVDLANQELQKDRVVKIISAASYHLRLGCAALIQITFLSGEVWHSTSTIYKQYCKIIEKDVKPLGYRRVSELLTELQNSGLALSQTSSKGRHGYGTQYKLTVSPEIIGQSCFSEWWADLVKRKTKHEADLRSSESWKPLMKKGQFGFTLSKQLEESVKRDWDSYVGLD